MERALLRNGNVYSSDDWKSVLEPIIERYTAGDYGAGFSLYLGFCQENRGKI